MEAKENDSEKINRVQNEDKTKGKTSEIPSIGTEASKVSPIPVLNPKNDSEKINGVANEDNAEDETSEISTIGTETLKVGQTSAVNPLTDSSGKKNPFLIAAVIECVCGFLKLKDIKKVRYLCKEWEMAAAPILRERSRISFGYPSHPKTFSRSIANFKDVFQNSSTTIPFTAATLTLLRKSKTAWTDAILRDLFKTVGKGINDLVIDKIKMANDLQVYDMDHILKTLHITKLHVPHELGFLQLQFSLDALPHVKSLKLHDCKVVFLQENSISPVEIELVYCRFLFVNTNKERCINKYINFKNMKRCKIMSYPNYNMTLDLEGQFELDSLSLTGVTVLNWKYSNWKITDFSITVRKNRSSIVDPTLIDIKNMTIQECVIIMNAIPRSVENLSFISDVGIAQTIDNLNCYYRLPNLKRLKIAPNDMHNFQRCISVVSLEISSSERLSGKRHIMMEWIPKPVKNLRIVDALDIRGYGIRQMEKLVFRDYSLTTLSMLLIRLNPNLLVIDLVCYIRDNGHNYDNEIQEFLKAVDRTKSVAIGPVIWQFPGMFRDDRIAKLLDKENPYYLFANGMGISISKSEFDKLKTI